MGKFLDDKQTVKSRVNYKFLATAVPRVVKKHGNELLAKTMKAVRLRTGRHSAPASRHEFHSSETHHVAEVQTQVAFTSVLDTVRWTVRRDCAYAQTSTRTNLASWLLHEPYWKKRDRGLTAIAPTSHRRYERERTTVDG